MIELLKGRKSIRQYSNKKIEIEKIEKIIDAALLSPSSRNRKPWEFIVVNDKSLLERLSNVREIGGKFLKEAPLAIAIISDIEKCDVWIEDCTITGIIMQLEAEKLNLGSCWIQIRKRIHSENISASEYVKNVLDIPEKYEVLSIISIGYKENNNIKEKQILEKETKIHYNKY